MALSSRSASPLIGDSCLTDWVVIGSGGFGQVYKARHHPWCCDVAIKLLHHDDGTGATLRQEVEMMCKGSSPFVIQVLGVFQGKLPSSGPSTHLGLVMEFMERGSLASLQKSLGGTQPWPLVFRLAHQVALGINFLHCLSPALLHLDLKPSNVLLDSSLNAKLTDFGLARFYSSTTCPSKKDSEEKGGTFSYMPPEAFELSYTPTRASDIYSYGILLWSIVTGKQPYANALSSMVRWRIPQGDRPSLDDIRCQSGITGLTRLINLMEKCWGAKPSQRPSSRKCTTETEDLYKLHKHTIHDAVHEVLKKLDENEERIRNVTEGFQEARISQDSGRTRVPSVNIGDILTGPPPVQEVHGGWTANDAGQMSYTDLPSPQPDNLCRNNHPSTETKEKLSSVHPIQALPQKLDIQRQLSIPDKFPASGVYINMSNVNGLQYGNNNSMHICTHGPVDRRRHPTAPSRVNLPMPHPGSRGDKKGGVG